MVQCFTHFSYLRNNFEDWTYDQFPGTSFKQYTGPIYDEDHEMITRLSGATLFSDLPEREELKKLLGEEALTRLIKHPKFGCTGITNLPSGLGTILLYKFYANNRVRLALNCNSCGQNALLELFRIANELEWPFVLKHPFTPYLDEVPEDWEFSVNGWKCDSYLVFKTTLGYFIRHDEEVEDITTPEGIEYFKKGLGPDVIRTKI